MIVFAADVGRQQPRLPRQRLQSQRRWRSTTLQIARRRHIWWSLSLHPSLLLALAASVCFPYAGGRRGCPLGWRQRRLGGEARWRPDKAVRHPSGDAGSKTCRGRRPTGCPCRRQAVPWSVLLYAVGNGRRYGRCRRQRQRRSLAKHVAGVNDVIIIIINVFFG